jgi:predicted nucleotidyltransferase
MLASIVNEVAEFAHRACFGSLSRWCSKLLRGSVLRGEIEFLSEIQILVGAGVRYIEGRYAQRS